MIRSAVRAGTKGSSIASTSSQLDAAVPSYFLAHKRMLFAVTGDKESEKIDKYFTSRFYDNSVEDYATRQTRHISVKEMLEFGRDNSRGNAAKMLSSARFVQREMPIRLAKRLLQLEALPYVVVTNPNINHVYRSYHAAFTILRQLPMVRTAEHNQEFTTLLQRMVQEHAPVINALARGLKECKSKPHIGDQLDLDGFMSSMLASRISRRVLAEQHICLNQRREGYIGVISTDLNVKDAIKYNAVRCNDVCMETYGVNVQVLIEGDVDITCPYVPAHLDYMLFELLKNSFRAVVEWHKAERVYGSPKSLPPIIVRICDAEDNVTIRIADQGGGIAASMADKVWSYGVSSVDKPLRETEGGGHGDSLQPPPGATGFSTDFGNPSGGLGMDQRNPMAGFGFGLPLSRLYAQYFGGDLDLVNMPGYGMDAYLRISRIGDNTEMSDHA